MILRSDSSLRCSTRRAGLNQLIHVAVAEKLAAIRTEAFFRERGRGADIPKALAILERLGVENSPEPGDELPDDERQTA